MLSGPGIGAGEDGTPFFLGGTAPMPPVRGKRRIDVGEEYARRDFLRSGVRHQEEALGVTGDGANTRFSRGFFRRTGLEEGVKSRGEADEARKEERLHATRALRQARIREAEGRNRFNVVSGEFDPAAHKEAARGRKFIPDEPSEQLKKEGTRAMRDTSIRFYRPAEEEAPTAKERASRLGSDALDASRRASGVLGFGRAELPSAGVRDALDLARYDPRPAPGSPRRDAEVAMRRAKSSGAFAPTLDFVPGGADDPFAAKLETSVRRLRPGERAPDQIFDSSIPGALVAAMPDPETRAIRLEREIKRKLPPHARTRPKSLLATAVSLDIQREKRKKQQEIDLVRALH